jgi:hypothetical protein
MGELSFVDYDPCHQCNPWLLLLRLPHAKKDFRKRMYPRGAREPEPLPESSIDMVVRSRISKVNSLCEIRNEIGSRNFPIKNTCYSNSTKCTDSWKSSSPGRRLIPASIVHTDMVRLRNGQSQANCRYCKRIKVQARQIGRVGDQKNRLFFAFRNRRDVQ